MAVLLFMLRYLWWGEGCPVMGLLLSGGGDCEPCLGNDL